MKKSLYSLTLGVVMLTSFSTLSAQDKKPATTTTTTTTTTAAPAAAPQQAAPAPVDHSYKPLTLKLNESGSKYVRFIMWHQVWATATENNPGSLDVNGNDIGGKWTSDIALRRSRFLMYSQISPRFLVLTHWGINNQSFINGGLGSSPGGTATASNLGKKPQLYIHDAWTEYAIKPGQLHVGGGLHYWNGVSRLSSNSTLNIMTLDAPIFNWFNIEATDQFARQMGVYAKGQLGKLDYRISINKPFINGASVAAKGSTLPAQAKGAETAANVMSEKPAFQGYANYMIWDKEANTLPFYVGTYLGSKKVMNIGAGFYSQGEAMAYRTSGVTTADSITKNNQLILGVDFFLDMPTKKGKGDCINVLLTYYNMDFGPRYLRNLGILNEHATAPSTATSFAGGGNLQPTIGTGSIFYAQVGYAFPKNKMGYQFMPYMTVTNKKFERLADPSTQMALGLNWFVNGHNAKITAEFATRPLYKLDGTSVVKNGSAGQFTIQSHIFL